jgi:hypothetical protein
MRLPSRALVIFVLCCLASYLLMWRQVRLYDEGIILTGAMRVQAGDLLHRDFYANYGPAQFYIVAALFQLFAADVMVERAWDIAVRGGIAALIYVLIASRARGVVAFAAAAVATVWLASVGNHGYPVYPALFFSLLAAHLLERSLTRNSLPLAACAGACVAVVTLFRYDVGFFALAALVAGSLFAQVPGTAGFAVRLTRQALLMTGVAGAIVLTLLANYAASGALAGFYHDVVEFPARAYVRTRSLPLPPLEAVWKQRRLLPVVMYLPLFACVAGLLVLIRKSPGKMPLASAGSEDRSSRLLVVLLIPLTAMFFLKGVVRLSTDQLQLSLLASIPLLALGWHLSAGRKAARATVNLIWLVTAASAGAFGYLAATRDNLMVESPFRIGLGVLHGEPSVEPERGAALRYVRSNSSSGDLLFVGLARHDKTILNDVSAYFLSGRMPATKWHQFDPGLQNSARIQTEIVRELQARQPRLVWLESSFDWIVEPNESAVSSGVTLLDDYLRSAYMPAATFGAIQILKRKLGE